uniref:Uncharacterized protein n=1 Tax=Anopheles culicifacies TaxID=139723 RepID=A0A182MVT0_9DIPT
MMILFLNIINLKVFKNRLNFRISKYCGEHLIVGNEVHWEPLDGDSDEDSTDGTDEIYGIPRPETAGSSETSWRQQTPNEPPTTDDGIVANGSANDVPGPDVQQQQPSAARDPNDGGEDLRDESLVTLQEHHYAAAAGGGSPYRRLARAGEPRAEALQAATPWGSWIQWRINLLAEEASARSLAGQGPQLPFRQEPPKSSFRRWLDQTN